MAKRRRVSGWRRRVIGDEIDEMSIHDFVRRMGLTMKLHTDHWQLRLMGVLFGAICLALGLSGAFFGEAGGPADFAVIAIVTGLIATLGSLISDDIIGFWYCNAKRLAARRAREARSSDLSTGL